VLLACQGQLRLTPSGHVVGIDMRAALKIGAARGCDLVVLSELLPAAEPGLIEALCAGRGGATELQQTYQSRMADRLRPLRSTSVSFGLHPAFRGIFRQSDIAKRVQEVSQIFIILERFGRSRHVDGKVRLEFAKDFHRL
jgi:hypothetical protein